MKCSRRFVRSVGRYLFGRPRTIIVGRLFCSLTFRLTVRRFRVAWFRFGGRADVGGCIVIGYVRRLMMIRMRVLVLNRCLAAVKLSNRLFSHFTCRVLTFVNGLLSVVAVGVLVRGRSRKTAMVVALVSLRRGVW